MSLIHVVEQVTAVDEPYVGNQSFKFDVVYENNSYVPNTIEIVGNLVIQKSDGSTNNISQDAKCYFDTTIGAHGLFRTIITQFGGRTIETVKQYNRMVKAKTVAKNYDWDLMSKTSSNMALQYANDNLVPKIHSKSANASIGSTYVKKVPFSFKPDISLNNIVQGELMSNKNRGNISIELFTCPNTEFLYGTDAGNYIYSIEGLEIHCDVMEGVDKYAPLVCNTVEELDNNFSSNNANMYATIESNMVKGISCTFLKASSRASATLNSLELQPLPNVERISFNFNSTLNEFIKHDLIYPFEMMANYLSSWGVPLDGKNMMSSDKYFENGKNFGVGVNFGQYMSLKNTVFRVNIQSGVNSEYQIYMFLHSQQQL